MERPDEWIGKLADRITDKTGGLKNNLADKFPVIHGLMIASGKEHPGDQRWSNLNMSVFHVSTPGQEINERDWQNFCKNGRFERVEIPKKSKLELKEQFIRQGKLRRWLEECLLDADYQGQSRSVEP